MFWEEAENASPFLHGASVMVKTALGKRGGWKVRIVHTFGRKEYGLSPKCASCRGYSLHATVLIPRKDGEGLERMCRYIARPSMAQERLGEGIGGGL